MKSNVVAGLSLLGLALGHPPTASVAVQREVRPERALFCALETGGGPTIFASSAADLVAPCPVEGTWRCDGELEPLDLEAARICAGERSRFVTGRLVTVDLSGEHQTMVEWLDWQPDGNLAVLARRVRTVASAIQIVVASSPSRLLRLTRRGATPMTIHADSIPHSGVTLPQAQRGAEFVGLIQAARIIPASFELDGPQSTLLERGNSLFVRAGNLAPGVYTLTPIYEGKIRGDTTSLVLREGESTFATTRAAPVGGVSIRGPDSTPLCREAALRLLSIGVYESGGPRREYVANVESNSGCTWTLEGLKAGTYQAELVVPNGSLGSSDPFTVEAQTTSLVTIAASSVEVVGVVSVAGNPIAEATLTFIAEASRRSPWVSTVTDASGLYVAMLPYPGAYQVLLQERGNSASLGIKDLEALAGRNEFNWTLPGGTIKVQIKGALPDLPISVQFNSNRDSIAIVIEPGKPPEVTHHGLALGDYDVSATQGNDLVSTIHHARLDSRNSTATAVVNMIRSNSRLLLRDVAGNPLRGARVRPLRVAGPTQILGDPVAETEAGVYSLQALIPGSSLLVQASGVVPVCVHVPLDQTTQVTVEPGRPVNVQLPSDFSPRALPMYSVAGASNWSCPVPFTALISRVVSDGPGSPSTVLIDHFPTETELQLHRQGVVRTFSVPADGIVLFPR